MGIYAVRSAELVWAGPRTPLGHHLLVFILRTPTLRFLKAGGHLVISDIFCLLGMAIGVESDQWAVGSIDGTTSSSKL